MNRILGSGNSPTTYPYCNILNPSPNLASRNTVMTSTLIYIRSHNLKTSFTKITSCRILRASFHVSILINSLRLSDTNIRENLRVIIVTQISANTTNRGQDTGLSNWFPLKIACCVRCKMRSELHLVAHSHFSRCSYCIAMQCNLLSSTKIPKTQIQEIWADIKSKQH